MKKSTRALTGMIILDLLLLLGTYWLVLQAKSGGTTVSPEEAISTITSIGGGAIGIVTVILGLAYFLHRKNGN